MFEHRFSSVHEGSKTCDTSVPMRGLVVFAVLLWSGTAFAKESSEPPAGKPIKTKVAKPPQKSSLPVETTDFAAQVKTLFRVAACGSEDAIPERFNAKAIERHCKEMTDLYASYHRAWADQASKFISALRPANTPKTIVYPFGGG